MKRPQFYTPATPTFIDQEVSKLILRTVDTGRQPFPIKKYLVLTVKETDAQGKETETEWTAIADMEGHPLTFIPFPKE